MTPPTTIIDLVQVRESITMSAAIARIGCDAPTLVRAHEAGIIQGEKTADGTLLFLKTDVEKFADQQLAAGNSLKAVSIERDNAGRRIEGFGQLIADVSTNTGTDTRWLEASYYALSDGRHALQIRFKSTSPADEPFNWAKYVRPDRVISEIHYLNFAHENILTKTAHPPPPPPPRERVEIADKMRERLKQLLREALPDKIN